MAEQHLENVGPNDMIVATSMLTPPKSVVNLRFVPRTLPLQTFLVMAATATLGFLIATAVAGSSMQSLVYGVMLGGAAGYIVNRMSPLEGESMLTWLGLQAMSATGKKVTIDGERCARYVGFAPLHWTSMGTVRMRPGCVNVRATDWDERGYPEWGADDGTNPHRESSTELLRRHMEGRPTNVLRPMAGMSLSDILAQQEREREEQRKRIHRQLPSNNGAPGRKKVAKKARKKSAPETPSLRPTAGRSERPAAPAPVSEKPAKGLGKKKGKAPAPKKARATKADAPKQKVRKRGKKKAPANQQLKPTAGRSRSAG